MITTQLLRPESIVVVGASNNVHKPGGAILKNLINGGYRGELRAVNPKEKEVQGVPAFADVNDLPDTDLAVLAVPASMCPDMVETLASKKQTRAFIILSAGFGEETHEGALLEERILETIMEESICSPSKVIKRLVRKISSTIAMTSSSFLYKNFSFRRISWSNSM